jgi:hypothetical protein
MGEVELGDKVLEDGGKDLVVETEHLQAVVCFSTAQSPLQIGEFEPSYLELKR